VRVALVHDWLTGMRGGEKVLEALCELHPGADIFTLFHHRGSVSPAIERHRIETSFVQPLPLVRPSAVIARGVPRLTRPFQILNTSMLVCGTLNNNEVVGLANEFVALNLRELGPA